MRSNQPETILKFQIKSLDPARPTIDFVPTAEGLSVALQARLNERFPGAVVSVRRAEGIPGARELQELLLHVDWHAVAGAVEGTIAGFATKELLKLMKEKLRNVFVKPVPKPGSPPVVASNKKAKHGKSRVGRKKKSRSSRNKRKR